MFQWEHLYELYERETIINVVRKEIEWDEIFKLIIKRIRFFLNLCCHHQSQGATINGKINKQFI